MILLWWELFRFDFFKYVMSPSLHLTCQSPALPDSPAWLQGVALFILDPDCCFLTYAGFCFSQPQQQVILLRSLAKCRHMSNMRKHHWRDRLPVYYRAFFPLARSVEPHVGLCSCCQVSGTRGGFFWEQDGRTLSWSKKRVSILSGASQSFQQVKYRKY